MMRTFTSLLAMALIAVGFYAAPAHALNIFGGTVPTGSGSSGAGQCTGIVYEGLGASGASPSFTLPSGLCTAYLDSGTATDTFATVTATLPARIDGASQFNVVTTRQITTLQFVSSDGSPIYVNGTTATAVSGVSANQGIALIAIGGAWHVQSNITVLASSGSGSSGSGGSGSGGGTVAGGGSGTTTGSFNVASGSGTGFGAGQAARVFDFRNTEGVNVQSWWNPNGYGDATNTTGGPFYDPESKVSNCQYAQGMVVNSACTMDVGCTAVYDSHCWPNEAAGFIALINYFGIYHARTNPGDNVDTQLAIKAAIPGWDATEGVSIPGQHSETLSAAQWVSAAAALQSTVTTAFEGPNEVDQSSDNLPSSYDGQTSHAGMTKAFEYDIRTAMNAAGYSSTFPLFGPSITISCNADTGTNYTCYSSYSNEDTSSGANFANAHDYMSSNYITFSNTNGNGDEITEDYSHQISAYGGSSVPEVLTEAGVPTNPYPQGWGYEGAVDAITAAKFDTAFMFQAWKDGVKRFYFYQLVADCYADPVTDSENNTDECSFGLADNTYTPKQNGQAIHNLNTILTDTGSTASTFTTGSLSYTVSGAPSTTTNLLFQDSSGYYYIVLNNQPNNLWVAGSSATTAGHANTISSTNVTVGFGATAASVAVYNPISASTATTTSSSVASIVVPVSDSPVIIKLHL